MSDFNPNSTDSVFAMIIQRLDNQDKTAAEYRSSLKEAISRQEKMLQEIKAQTEKTNGRVDALEQERWYQRGMVAAFALTITMIWEYLKNRWK